MDIPEEVQKLVDELGETVVSSLLSDERSRALVLEIQAHGFDLALSVEASIALTPREREDADAAAEGHGWSEEDKAFLKTFRIKLDE